MILTLYAPASKEIVSWPTSWIVGLSRKLRHHWHQFSRIRS